MKRRKGLKTFIVCMIFGILQLLQNGETIIASELPGQVDVLKQETYRWNNFSYSILEDGTCEAWYETYEDTKETEIIYPKEIEGRLVSSVRISSFNISNEENITKISLPDTISEIYVSADNFVNLETIELYGTNEKTPPLTIDWLGFAGSKKLKSIDPKLFSNVSLIDDYAFWEFPLDTIEINGDKIEVKEYAFGEKLEDIKIVGNEVVIKGNAFNANYTKNLKSLSIEGISVLDKLAFGVDEVIFNKLEKLSLKGKQFDIQSNGSNVRFPELRALILYGVENIGDFAFYNSNMLSILELGEGLKSIGSCAFLGCSRLTEIALPNSVENIRRSAFEDCSNLEKVTTFGEAYNQQNGNKVDGFSGCDNLNYLEIPKSIIQIDSYMCYRNRNLREVIIPEGCTTIGESAFSGCESLSSIVLPESVTTIGEDAFYHCISLTSVKLSNKINTIGNSAFSNCYNLSTVETYGEISEESGEGLGSFVFFRCWRIKKIEIPESIDKICKETFVDCTFESFVVPTHIKQIEERAFNNCTFESFVIPTHIKQIEKEALYASKLTYIEFSEGVEEIAEGVMDDCFVDEVRLPASIIKISRPSNVYYVVDEENKMYSAVDGVLFNKDKTKLLSYPQNKEDIYYVIPDGVESIGEYAFGGNSYLEKIEYPEGIKEICDRAFWVNTGVAANNNKIPDSVISVGEEAYSNSNYTASQHGNNIIIPASVESIGKNAYSNLGGWYSYPKNVYFYNAKCKIGGILNEKMQEQGWTIFGYQESTAYDYAKEYGLRFCDIETGQQLLPTVEPLPSPVDKNTLTETINTTEELNKADYTESSWNELQSVLEEAIALLEEEDISQEAVDEMVEKINTAVKNLVEAPKEIPATDVTLSQIEMIVEIGKTIELKAVVEPADTTDEVMWIVENAEIATVVDGKVTAVAAGETKVTVKVGELSASCKVTVVEESKEEEPEFEDVSVSGWQYSFVKFAVKNQLMKGKGTTEDGKIIFDPNNNMTRAEFVQTLYNKEGKPAVTYQSTFTDVKDGQWYTNAIMWASQNGIVAGKGNKFDVSGNITRQEMATILCKYATNYKKYETAGRADVSAYTDVATISSWATENMKWAVHYGIMKGKGDKLAPQANASRAECATMLKNFMDAYE